MIVRVAPDVRGLSRRFDYLVPPTARSSVAVGSEVRIDLHGRRVGGWITDVDIAPIAGVTLRELAKVRGLGPSPELIGLAEWSAWRWVGPVSAFLRTASAPAAVSDLPAAAQRPAGLPQLLNDAQREVLAALTQPGAVVARMSPTVDRFPLIATAAVTALRTCEGVGSVLVVCPSVAAARLLGGRLARHGLPVAVVADEGPASVGANRWALAAAGGRVVVGARAAAWAPAPGLALAIVVDEHDEALQSERSPTWNARDVVVERAHRAGAPALLMSPCPTLEALSVGRLIEPRRADERSGWPALELVDRREEDPLTASSLMSPQLVAALTSEARVACVLNRAGRARLLACRACGDLARCEVCGAAVGQQADGDLVCRRCQTARPSVCVSCGSGALKVLRAGVARLRDDISALIGEAVDEVTTSSTERPSTRVVIGTEAVLHRVGKADVVAFCDIDQELTAPRFRAAEQALALLARAARVVGARGVGGRVLVQTRLVDHPVLQAALHGDPGRLAESEAAIRAQLRFPPATALAMISGESAADFVSKVKERSTAGIDLLGPTDGAWLVRAPGHRELADVLTAVEKPTGRLRIEVDPLRV